MNQSRNNKSWEIFLFEHFLLGCFPDSIISEKNEFIADKESGDCFRLDDCNTVIDIKCKILEWLSRAAYKSQPFNSEKKNARLHKKMLGGINKALGTNFKFSDMEVIYTYLGNRANHAKTIAFIESGYDMKIFEKHGSCCNSLDAITRTAEGERI